MTKLLLSIHVLAAIITIGPVTVAASMFPAATRRALAGPADPHGIAVLRNLHRICRVYAALGVLVPVFGLATASSLGVLGDPWLIISIVLTVAAAAVLAFLILPGQAAILNGENALASATTDSGATEQRSRTATGQAGGVVSSGGIVSSGAGPFSGAGPSSGAEPSATGAPSSGAEPSAVGAPSLAAGLSQSATGPSQTTPHSAAGSSRTAPYSATPHAAGPAQGTPHSAGPTQGTPHAAAGRFQTAAASPMAESRAAAASEVASPGGAISAGRVAARLGMGTGVFNLLWAVVVVLMIVRPGSTTGV